MYVSNISHGFSSGALFLGFGYLYQRLKEICIGGVAHIMPRFAALYIIFALANLGMPGTSGFVGELLVIVASFSVLCINHCNRSHYNYSSGIPCVCIQFFMVKFHTYYKVI